MLVMFKAVLDTLFLQPSIYVLEIRFRESLDDAQNETKQRCLFQDSLY